MRLFMAYWLTIILPAVAYVPPVEEQHTMLRSELHSNTSVPDGITRVSIGVAGVGDDGDAILRRTSENLKRDRLAVAELLKGDSKIGESAGAQGNASSRCSCSGEELSKMTCTCKTSSQEKNGSAVSNETANQTSAPLVPLEGTVAAFSPLTAHVQGPPVQAVPLEGTAATAATVVAALNPLAQAPPVQPVSFLSLHSLFSIRPADPPSSSLVQDAEPAKRAKRHYEMKRSLLWDALSSGMTIPSHHDMPTSRALSLIEFVNHTQAHRMMGITIPIAVIGTLFLVAVQLGGRDDRFAKM